MTAPNDPEEGLGLPASGDAENEMEFARMARHQFDAEIAQAGHAHDEYLAAYGSLGDTIRDMLELEAAERGRAAIARGEFVTLDDLLKDKGTRC